VGPETHLRLEPVYELLHRTQPVVVEGVGVVGCVVVAEVLMDVSSYCRRCGKVVMVVEEMVWITESVKLNKVT
jgi:hypothetical protein